MRTKEEIKLILADINILLKNNIYFDGLYHIREILNGKRNLGEYRDFKRKMKEYRYLNWFLKSKDLYNLLENYMEKTLVPYNRPQVCISMFHNILVLKEVSKI